MVEEVDVTPGWIPLGWFKGREQFRHCTAEKNCECDRCLLQSNDVFRLELLVHRRISRGGWRTSASPLNHYSELPRVMNYPDPARAIRAVMTACIDQQSIGFEEVISFLLARKEWKLLSEAIDQAHNRPTMVYKSQIVCEKFWRPYTVRVYNHEANYTAEELQRVLDEGQSGFKFLFSNQMYQWAIENPEFVKKNLEKGLLEISKMYNFVGTVLNTYDRDVVTSFMDLVRKELDTQMLVLMKVGFQPDVEYFRWLETVLPIDDGEDDIHHSYECGRKVIMNRRMAMDSLIADAENEYDVVARVKYYVEKYGAYPDQMWLNHYPELVEAFNMKRAKDDKYAKQSAVRQWLEKLFQEDTDSDLSCEMDGSELADAIENVLGDKDEDENECEAGGEAEAEATKPSKVYVYKPPVISEKARRFGIELMTKLRAEEAETADL